MAIPIAWVGLLTLCFSAFWFERLQTILAKPLSYTGSSMSISLQISCRGGKRIGAWVCLLWFGSHWAETWGSSLFERQEKGSCCCWGEIRELPLPAGQPLSSQAWPLSQWAAKSPKLTGWNPGLIKTGAKPPIDFEALAQRVTASKGRLAPLFMGLFRWLFLGGAQTTRSSPPLRTGSRLQTQLIIRQLFYQF